MTSVVCEGNLVSIPAELVTEYGLHAGSSVGGERSADGSWIVRPAKSRAEIALELLGAGEKFLKPGESGVANFLRFRAEEAELDGSF